MRAKDFVDDIGLRTISVASFRADQFKQIGLEADRRQRVRCFAIRVHVKAYTPDDRHAQPVNLGERQPVTFLHHGRQGSRQVKPLPLANTRQGFQRDNRAAKVAMTDETRADTAGVRL